MRLSGILCCVKIVRLVMAFDRDWTAGTVSTPPLDYDDTWTAVLRALPHKHNGSRLCAVATRAPSTGEGHYSSLVTSRVTDALSLDTKAAILKPGCVTGRDSW